jgi:hypothetical protein
MTSTAPIPLDLQKAAKEHLGFESTEVAGRHDASGVRSVTKPSSTA